ncbi:XdhC family aldehyde oxidoreductase maturation factor [Chloroflexota bacterium]
MNDNSYLAGIICEQLDSGSALVLASIVGLLGSAPQHRGAKMVVGANGKSYGTIGGSILEATVIKEAGNVLGGGQSRMQEFAMNNTDVETPGMICGGTAVVLLDYIRATRASVEFFRHWRDAVLNGKEFYFLTHVRGAGGTVDIVGHSILFADGNLIGDRLPAKEDIENVKAELKNISSTMVLSAGDARIVVDPIRRMGTLYCFGAGHVAMPTAHIAALAGFRVIVLDDRAEYANAGRFPEAHAICVIEDYNQAFAGLEIDVDSFIVILTRGHQHDLVVLEQALRTGAGYIGMISSKKKRKLIYEAIMARGIKKEELERVHSPIGISIGGKTPEEIAVSIVAELIKERAGKYS